MKLSQIGPKLPRPSHSFASDEFHLAIGHRLETPLWIFDIDHARIIWANDAACEIWASQGPEDLYARDLGSDMSQTVQARLKQYQSDFVTANATFTEQWTLYPNGQPTNLMVIYHGFRLEDGRMAMLCEAVAHAESTPENIRSVEALLHTDVMIALFASDGPPLYQNPSARNAFGNSTSRIADLFCDPLDQKRFQSRLEILGEHRQIARVKTASSLRWFDMSAKKCLDAATGNDAILLTAIDVSELKNARDTARHLADNDQLTDLFNRSYLQNHLDNLELSETDPGRALVIMDVDRFKLINDRFGHEAGDTVLKELAWRLRESTRSDDVVARWGGDEFVMCLNGIKDMDEFTERVNLLQRQLSQPVIRDNIRLDLTVSMGVALMNSSNPDHDNAMREADIALYMSKQQGRNRATMFVEEMGHAVRTRDQLEMELARAIQSEEFILHYQPQFDVESGRVIGVEGLVRWQHPTQGLLGPGAFIHVCEDTGLIEDLGRLVLRLGCRQAIEWAQAGLDLKVSLNVSPRQFGDEKFMTDLAEFSKLEGFPQGKIELEITENGLIGDHDLIAQKLRAITLLGYHIAIDDFGTGYSNLSYISRFPLTSLKIDRSFIDELPASDPIVSLILTLGQRIGAVIVSEGVETQNNSTGSLNGDAIKSKGS